jgi:DNA-binding LytR/AlgR family response regulator
MLKILIIDEVAVCKEIERIILSKLKLEEKVSEIKYCSSLAESWNMVREQPFRFDMLIINLGATKEDTEEVISNARAVYRRNHDLKILFVTTKVFVPLDVYKVPHVYVIRRPFTNESVVAAAEIISIQLKYSTLEFSKRIVTENGSGTKFIPKKDIIYAFKARHGVKIVTEKEILYHKCSMDDFVNEAGELFCRCHNSFVVNIRHVISISHDCINLDNGDIISISRSYKKAVKQFIKKIHA